MARAGEPQSMQQQTVTTNKTVTPALGGVSTATVCTTVVTPRSVVETSNFMPHTSYG